MSEETIDAFHHTIRKTAHAVEYAILGALIWRVADTTVVLGKSPPAMRLRLALLLAALYAATDEAHQIFVPNRQAAVADVVLDACGASVGIAMAWSLRRRFKSP